MAAIGAGGIAFTVLLYGSLFYFGFKQRGGVYDDLRAQVTQNTLNSLVPSVEFYKVQYGTYPASLNELQKSLPKGGFITVFDPSGAGFEKAATAFLLSARRRRPLLPPGPGSRRQAVHRGRHCPENSGRTR